MLREGESLRRELRCGTKKKDGNERAERNIEGKKQYFVVVGGRLVCDVNLNLFVQH